MRICTVFLLLALSIPVLCVAEESPVLSLRGELTGFPFWLGSTQYDNHWKGHEANELRSDWWWFDKENWKQRFASMERLHLSALSFGHPHPYVGLVDVPGFPEARYFDEATLARYQEMFHWILEEGKRHGISLYFLTWNICLPPGMVRKHNVAEFGVNTPLTRAYTRAAVAALFHEYPDLGGLITMAGEFPPGCCSFIEDAICSGLKDSGSNPELIFWSWCSYPEDSKKIATAYPNTRLLHYLQYEQLFSSIADPRIGQFSRACGNVPMVALGGPKSVHGSLFWGDPDWARSIVHTLKEQNGTGLFIETYCTETWLARESLAYYAYHPGTEDDSAMWAQAIEERYQSPGNGLALLEGMTHASRVMPCFLKLVHSQTDHYMPQFGMPLVYYVEMPTISTYVFENAQEVDARGYLQPNMGLCYPNPNWGEQVLSIRDTVEGKGPRPAIMPLQVAEELDGHAAAIAKAIEKVSATPTLEVKILEQRLLLNAALGEHCAAKIRAGVEWERFKHGEDTGAACLAALENSVKVWEKVSALSSELYPEPISFWRSSLPLPPPWTQNQIWSGYGTVRGHWRDHLEPFRKEVEFIRAQLAQPRENARLPLWKDLLGG